MALGWVALWLHLLFTWWCVKLEGYASPQSEVCLSLGFMHLVLVVWPSVLFFNFLIPLLEEQR